MARRTYVHPSQRPGPYTPTRGKLLGQTFASYRQYQNALAQAAGFPSASKRLAAARPVGVKAGAVALSRPSRARALRALNLLRKQLPITTALKEAGTTMTTVKRYVGGALRKGEGGRIIAAASDRYAAVMRVPTTAGVANVVVIGSRSRTLLGEYWSAVGLFRDLGASVVLDPFRGAMIRTDSGELPLLTDPRVLTNLLKEGRMSIETVYAKGR